MFLLLLIYRKTKNADLTQVQRIKKHILTPVADCRNTEGASLCSILEDIWVKIKQRARKRLSNMK